LIRPSYRIFNNKVETTSDCYNHSEDFAQTVEEDVMSEHDAVDELAGNYHENSVALTLNGDTAMILAKL
jgi:hypothetical protein